MIRALVATSITLLPMEQGKIVEMLGVTVVAEVEFGGESENTIDVEMVDTNGRLQLIVLNKTAAPVRQAGMVDQSPGHQLVLPMISTFLALCPLPRLLLHMQRDNYLMAQLFPCRIHMLLLKRGATKIPDFTKERHFTSTRKAHPPSSNHTSIHGLHLLLACT